MDKRILSLLVALVSTAVYIVSRRFLQVDPMETFVPALSGLGFVYAGLIVFQVLFAHLVPAAWFYISGLTVFGWVLILWPKHWSEVWMMACVLSLLVLGRVFVKSDRSYTRALTNRLMIGQILGLVIVAGSYFLVKAGVLNISVNLVSPAVLLFPTFYYWGIQDAERRRSQSYIVQSAKRDTFESLVQGLAHELNNPLNFIYANIEPLHELLEKLKKTTDSKEKEELGLEADRILKTMEEGVVRSRGLVDRFRDFPSGGVEPKETVNLNEVLDKSVEMLSPKWKDRLKVERRFGELPDVSAYPLQLAQIFTNVIANACDATPKGGRVTVSTQKGATGVKVSIKDTGQGIARDQIPRIFDPFFTTKEQGEGVGLGLSITQQLVKNHKGNIEVKSEVGKGTEFLISFPYS